MHIKHQDMFLGYFVPPCKIYQPVSFFFWHGDLSLQHTDMTWFPAFSSPPVALVSVSWQLGGFWLCLESLAVPSRGTIKMTVANAKSGSGKLSKTTSQMISLTGAVAVLERVFNTSIFNDCLVVCCCLWTLTCIPLWNIYLKWGHGHIYWEVQRDYIMTVVVFTSLIKQTAGNSSACHDFWLQVLVVLSATTRQVCY